MHSRFHSYNTFTLPFILRDVLDRGHRKKKCLGLVLNILPGRKKEKGMRIQYGNRMIDWW